MTWDGKITLCHTKTTQPCHEHYQTTGASDSDYVKSPPSPLLPEGEKTEVIRCVAAEKTQKLRLVVTVNYKTETVPHFKILLRGSMTQRGVYDQFGYNIPTMKFPMVQTFMCITGLNFRALQN